MTPDDRRTIAGSRIVQQMSGEGTGDVIYKTEDGSLWFSPVTPSDYDTTGISIEEIRGDRQ